MRFPAAVSRLRISAAEAARAAVIFLLLGAAQSLFSQSAINEVSVVNITDTSASISWKLDAAPVNSGSNQPGSPYLRVAPTPFGPWMRVGRQENVRNRLDRTINVSGLAPDTQYYFVPGVCGSRNCATEIEWFCTSYTAGTGWTCGAQGEPPSFRTLPAEPEESKLPQNPVLFSTDVPYVDGETFTVAGDCSDLETVLKQAVAADPAKNHQVLLPVGVPCSYASSSGYGMLTLSWQRNPVTLPKKTSNNWIVVRTAAPDTELPPAGVRTGPGWFGRMARIRSEWTGLSQESDRGLRVDTSCNFNTGRCNPEAVCGGPFCSRGWYFIGVEFSSLRWDEIEQVAANVSSVRLAGSTWQITTDRPLNLRGWSGMTVRVTGLQCADGRVLQGVFSATAAVGRPNYVQINSSMGCEGGWVEGTGKVFYDHGNKIVNAWPGSPITIRTEWPHGLAPGMVVQISSVGGIVGESVLYDGSASPLDANGPNGTKRVVSVVDDYMFTIEGRKGTSWVPTVGTGEYVPGTGLMAVDPAPTSGVVSIPGDAADIVFDRCRFNGWGFPSRVRGNFMYTTGTRVAVVNSYFDNMDSWRPVSDTTNGTAGFSLFEYANGAAVTAVQFLQFGPTKVENNFFDNIGITLFAEAARTPTGDIEISRNLIRHNLKGMYRPDNPLADGMVYRNSHWIECKQCARVKIDGNIMENCFGDRVADGRCLAFTARSADSAGGGASGIRDLAITNNIMRNFATGFFFSGQDGQVPTYTHPITSRILIRNNLSYAQDYWRMRRQGVWGVGGGYYLTLGGAVENVTIERNTVLDLRGPAPAWLVLLGGRSSHLVMRNNLFTHNNDQCCGRLGGLRAQPESMQPVPPARLATEIFSGYLTAWPEADNRSVFAPNLIVQGVNKTEREKYPDCGNSSRTGPDLPIEQQFCVEPPEAIEQFYAGSGMSIITGGRGLGIDTAQGRLAAAGWMDWEPNGEVNPSTPLRRFRRAPSENPMGADVDQIEVATGSVQDAWVPETGSTHAKLSYFAPDGQACTVEFGVDKTWGTGTRVADVGGDRQREVWLTDLQPDTEYEARILCRSEQPVLTFRTQP